jgi:hypothetical protein
MPTESQKREEIIERWMLTIVNDGSVRRFDDLHVNEIDPLWESRQQWIKGGLEALRIALAVRDKNHLPFTVGLGFSLESANRPIGVDFQSPEEFYEKIDWSPPSLYVFHRGEEPDKQVRSTDAVRYLNPVVLGVEGSARCYHLEFRQQGDDDYHRSVFVDG